MIENIFIDLKFCQKFKLTPKQGAFFNYLSKLKTFPSYEKIKTDLPLIFNKKDTIYRYLKILEKKKLIKLDNCSNEKYFKKNNKNFKEGCLFCGINDIPLHKHHYPIRAKDGGKDTINLCPNCHTRFHYKTDYSKKLIILKKGYRNDYKNN